jgi:mono/diheme cytochrome c family protein
MTMLAVIAVIAGTAAGAPANASLAGVEAPQRARMNWMLHCQGCHQPDASGSANGAPARAGIVARFLGVDGGRAYLARVPGVANAGLDNRQLAELLNWTLATFDQDHLPADFSPYTAEEIGVARKNPLLTQAATMRADLVSEFRNDASGGK